MALFYRKSDSPSWLLRIPGRNGARQANSIGEDNPVQTVGQNITLRELTILATLILLALVLSLNAQVPPLLSYQGSLAVNGTNFNGAAQFKFALINSNGTVSFWSNDNSSSGGSEPAQPMSLTVTQGLFTVMLGDATLSNMQPIAASVFTNPGVLLRIWVSSGTNAFQLLSPDQRFGAVGYAMFAATVPDGAVTSAKLAPWLGLYGEPCQWIRYQRANGAPIPSPRAISPLAPSQVPNLLPAQSPARPSPRVPSGCPM